MTITNEERWQWFQKYWDEFKGDIIKYDDSFTFSPTADTLRPTGGKDLTSFVDRMIKREQNV